MSSATDLITEQLREAQAIEQSSLSLLQGHLRGAPPGPYRTAARRHLHARRALRGPVAARVARERLGGARPQPAPAPGSARSAPPEPEPEPEPQPAGRHNGGPVPTETETETPYADRAARLRE